MSKKKHKEKQPRVCPNCRCLMFSKMEEYEAPAPPNKDGSLELISYQYHCLNCGWSPGKQELIPKHYDIARYFMLEIHKETKKKKPKKRKTQ